MTVYARGDVACVSISPNHGGCGSTHSRPAPGGNPVELWALSCNRGCEDLLRKDPLWATTVSEVPETYDETLVREDNEKRGKLDAEKRALSVQNDTAEALKVLAAQAQDNGGIAAAIQALALSLAGNVPPVMPVSAEKPLNQAAGKASAPVPEDVKPADDLEDLSYADLKKLASRLGVKITRSRDAQLALIREHLGE
jgi:hypothetical protein